MAKDDISIQNLFIFEDHGIKVDRVDLLSLSILFISSQKCIFSKFYEHV